MQRKHMVKYHMDQCMTGLTDSHGEPIKKLTEMYANNENC